MSKTDDTVNALFKSCQIMPEMENVANASCQIEKIFLMHHVEDRECCYSTLEKENVANRAYQ